MKSLATSAQQFQQQTQQFQQQTKEDIQDLRSQISQLVTSMNKLENQGKLPSQPTVNPRQDVNAINLRSGKEIPGGDGKHAYRQGLAKEGEIQKEVETEKADTQHQPVTVNPEKPPFPHRLAKKKKGEDDKEILKMFEKMEINIPLLTAIK